MSVLRSDRDAIWLPGLKLDSPNEQLRGLTRGARLARASKAKKQRAIGYLSTLSVAKRGPAHVRFWRIAPRPFDSDNLAGAFKHVRDGVAQAFGVSDADGKGLTFEYRQASGAVREYAVVIQVMQP